MIFIGFHGLCLLFKNVYGGDRGAMAKEARGILKGMGLGFFVLFVCFVFVFSILFVWVGFLMVVVMVSFFVLFCLCVFLDTKEQTATIIWKSPEQRKKEVN